MLHERLRPYLFVVGSLVLLVVVFALLAFAFARYYVNQRDRELRQPGRGAGQDLRPASAPVSVELPQNPLDTRLA
ncbi:MAG: hypothetical protein ACRD5W_15955 [Candidatus Acidiferrales bacterium]